MLGSRPRSPGDISYNCRHSGPERPKHAYTQKKYFGAIHFCKKVLGSGLRRTDFFADFYLWAAGFFRGFFRRIFSPHLNPWQNLPKFIQQNPRHVSAERLGQKLQDNYFTKQNPSRFLFANGDTPVAATLPRNSFGRIPLLIVTKTIRGDALSP